MSNPSFAQLLTVYESGRLREAIRLAADYSRQNPKDWRGYHVWAQALLDSNDIKQAERAVKSGLKAVKSAAPLWDIYGQIADAQNRPTLAEKHYKKASLCDKSEVLYPYHLGRFYEKHGRVAEARKAYNDALKRNPEYAPAHNNLGLLALDEEDNATAEAAFETALRHDENYHAAWHNLSHVKVQYNDEAEQAIDCAKRAVQLSPSPHYLMTLAKHYGALGQAEQAAEHYRKALASDNGRYVGNIWLAIARYAADEKDLKAIDEAIKATDNPMQKGLLELATANIYERQKQYPQAERHYLQGNRLLRPALATDYLRYLSGLVDELQKLFADTDLSESADSEERALFIVGTMRCGSSLLEQILACHSDIGGAGEVNHLSHAISEHGGNLQEPQKLSALLTDSAAREKIASQYQERLGYFFRDRPAYIADKQLDNFLHIGWIRLLMPSAKIILCRRNPEDAALSIFCNHFTSGAHSYAYDMEDIAEFFALYEKLTTFWCDKCGDSLYELQYEALVSEPQKTLQGVMGFLGLKPQKSMENFAASRRAVQTASSSQVRSDIHKDSVGKIARFPEIQKLWQEAQKTLKNNSL